MKGPERSLEHSGYYAAALKDLAGKRGLPALDLWTKLQEIPHWQELLSDGLHFTPEGNRAVFEQLICLIEQELPQFRQSSKPLARWDVIMACTISI